MAGHVESQNHEYQRATFYWSREKFKCESTSQNSKIIRSILFSGMLQLMLEKYFSQFLNVTFESIEFIVVAR